RALQILASADRLRPDHSSAYHLRRAFCLARKGDRSGEAGALAEAGRVRPETAFDHFLCGQQHYKRHQLPEAIQDFETALRLRPAPDDELHYVLLVNRGLIRFQRGHLDEAAADYREAIRFKKDPFLAHAELAHVALKQNKPDEAIEQFTRAIALKLDWAPLY